MKEIILQIITNTSAILKGLAGVIVTFVIIGAKLLKSKLQHFDKLINNLGNLSNRALSALAKANIRNEITKEREQKEATKIINGVNYFENLNKRNFIIKLFLLNESKAEIDDLNRYLHEVIIKREFDMII